MKAGWDVMLKLVMQLPCGYFKLKLASGCFVIHTITCFLETKKSNGMSTISIINFCCLLLLKHNHQSAYLLACMPLNSPWECCIFRLIYFLDSNRIDTSLSRAFELFSLPGFCGENGSECFIFCLKYIFLSCP